MAPWNAVAHLCGTNFCGTVDRGEGSFGRTAWDLCSALRAVYLSHTYLEQRVPRRPVRLIRIHRVGTAAVLSVAASVRGTGWVRDHRRAATYFPTRTRDHRTYSPLAQVTGPLESSTDSFHARQGSRPLDDAPPRAVGAHRSALCELFRSRGRWQGWLSLSARRARRYEHPVRT